MGVTALGASVKRTEDIRFITGKGRYVDDINRPGQAYAYFLRSPHAHATIDKIDASAALKSPGVVAIFTGDDIAADKVGGLICGWIIHSKDGSPMNVGGHPSLAQGAVRYVGDHVAVVIADTYAEGEGRGGKNRRGLRGAACGDRHYGRRQARPTVTALGPFPSNARKTSAHHRQGPLRRRRQPSGPGLRLFSALAPRARDDRQDRDVGSAEVAGSRRDLHRRRHRGRQGRRPHLRLDESFQGRFADERRRPSLARARGCALCRRSCRRRHRRYIRRGEGRGGEVVVDYGCCLR